MAFLATDKSGEEWIYDNKPHRSHRDNVWIVSYGDNNAILLTKGSIYKLIGKQLTWEDEPVMF